MRRRRIFEFRSLATSRTTEFLGSSDLGRGATPERAGAQTGRALDYLGGRDTFAALGCLGPRPPRASQGSALQLTQDDNHELLPLIRNASPQPVRPPREPATTQRVRRREELSQRVYELCSPFDVELAHYVGMVASRPCSAWFAVPPLQQ